jgi:site-specific recombinase XerD
MSINIRKTDRKKPYRAEVKVSGMNKTSKSFMTQGEAREWGMEMERTLKANRFTPSLMNKDRLLVHAIDIYIEQVMPTKSKGSQQQTLNRLNEWKRMLGATRMIEITGTKIHYLLDKQTCQGPTKNRKLGTLSAVMTYFTKAPNQWLTENPCHKVLRWLENDNRTRTFTDQEFETLYQDALSCSQGAAWWQKSRLQLPLYLRLLRETGIRRGESRRICVKHMDWEDGFLKIQGKDIVKETGNHVERLTIVSDELRADLAKMVEDENLTSDDPLFKGKLGKCTDFDHHFADIRKRHGLEGAQLGFHCIRHTAITAMSRKTQDIYKLKMYSGHKTTAMLDVYVNNDKDDVKALFEL